VPRRLPLPVAAGDEEPGPVPILNTVRMHRTGCPAFRLAHLAPDPTAVSRAAPERQQTRCCPSKLAVHHPLACTPRAELALAGKGSAPVRDCPASFASDFPPGFPLVARMAAAGMANTAAARCIARVGRIAPEDCIGPVDCTGLEDYIGPERYIAVAGIAVEDIAAAGIAAADVAAERIAADCTAAPGIVDAPAAGRTAAVEPGVEAASLCPGKYPAEADQRAAAGKQEPGLAQAVCSHRQQQAAVPQPAFWEVSNADNRRTQEEPHHHISDIST